MWLGKPPQDQQEEKTKTMITALIVLVIMLKFGAQIARTLDLVAKQWDQKLNEQESK